MSWVHAPWNDDQVASLRSWQRSPWVHPLTCSGGNGGEDCPGGGDVLRVTPDALICDACGRTQDAAPKACTTVRGPHPQATDGTP
jgi:hypothetical protein